MSGYLLDTHVSLLWALEPEKLPAAMREILASPHSRVVFSVVSSWEAQIKAGLGKLALATVDPLIRAYPDVQTVWDG